MAEAGYSITIVQIYNALTAVGPQEGGAISAVASHTHLTNLVRWATHLYLYPEHEPFLEYITAPP